GADHVDLQGHRRRVFALMPARRNHAMPEQRHLLLQGALGIDHAIDPTPLPYCERVLHERPQRVIAANDVLLYLGEAFRMQQIFHNSRIALSGVGFEFLPRGAKPSTAHKVGEQRQVIVGHRGLLPCCSITRWRLQLDRLQTLLTSRYSTTSARQYTVKAQKCTDGHPSGRLTAGQYVVYHALCAMALGGDHDRATAIGNLARGLGPGSG